MRILVLGTGGREHALAWRLAQPEHVTHTFVAPGNAGTELDPILTNVNLDPSKAKDVVQFCQVQSIDLVVIGPEHLIAQGLVDQLQVANIKVFGPTRAAGQLEASKSYAKAFMQKYVIPTASYQVFTDRNAALAALASTEYPVVIKADGLAAGKGVVVALDRDQAEHAVTEMLTGNRFGEAGHTVVIEAFLPGEEASFIALCDGQNCLPLASSQDHKRLLDNDQGPNTGGMGAYSPAPVLTQAIEQKVLEKIVNPTLAGMRAEGHPFVGFLYVGLMIHNDEPFVVEYNCRMGDPETQPIMLRMRSDLSALCIAAIEQRLTQCQVDFCEQAAIGVVLATQGYPIKSGPAVKIHGLPLAATSTVKVFHAATQQSNGELFTNGGRVLCITALGDTLAQAKHNVYEQVDKIQWDGIQLRRDIGHRAL